MPIRRPSASSDEDFGVPFTLALLRVALEEQCEEKRAAASIPLRLVRLLPAGERSVARSS